MPRTPDRRPGNSFPLTRRALVPWCTVWLRPCVASFPTVSLRLFIPGPVQVSEKTYQALGRPVMGHRSSAFVDLYQSIQPRLKALFQTTDPVFLSTSSAWGVMEGSIRNLTRKGVLNLMCGAFSDKWNDVAKRCGLPAGALAFEWGTPVDPEALRRELATAKYDVVTLIHNETSCGVLNPLPELMAVLREFPDVLSIVDTVSSFSAMPINKDELGIDVMLTGTQKALALPPGMALLAVSERALARARTVENRGYYFDFIEFLANHEKGMTPSTPVIPLIHALDSKLEDIFAEGLIARFARHARLNATVRSWASQRGFSLFPAPEFGSLTLNCLRAREDVAVADLVAGLKLRHGIAIDGGYGKLKGKTFRLSNMGDETDATIAGLLEACDDVLDSLAKA